MKRSNHQAASLLLFVVELCFVHAFLNIRISRRQQSTIIPSNVPPANKKRSQRICLHLAGPSSAENDTPHGYMRDPIDDTRVDEASIHELLMQRTEARQQQAFGVADAIRDRLLHEHGVRVSDSTRQWRTGCNQQSGSGMNKKWGRPTEESATGNASPPSRTVERRQDFGRERGPGRFQEPRLIRHDGPKSRLAPYREGDTMHSVTNEDPARATMIQALVDERDVARWERNYAVADSIQQDLFDIHGVEINDRKRLWREKSVANSERGRRSPAAPRLPQQRPSPRSLPQLRGTTSSLTDDQVIQVEKMIGERAAAQERKDFSLADRIRAALRNEFAVGIDDRSSEWCVAGGDYDRSPLVIGNFDEEMLSLIQQQVQQRSVAKMTMDYETADRIRDELMEKYQVTIDDRQKLWSFLEPPEIDISVDPNTSLESQTQTQGDLSSSEDTSIEESETDSLEYSESDSDDTAEEPSATAEGQEDLSLLKVPELKERLRTAGLPVSGLKAELIDRLSQSN